MRSAHLLRAAGARAPGVASAVVRCVPACSYPGGASISPRVVTVVCCRSFSAVVVKASTGQIKALRESSGAPITECRDALQGVLTAGQTDGTDAAVMQAAVEWLRKKGISTAAKKSGRAASEGLVAISLGESGLAAALVELNSETDFAARNNTFRQLCANIGTAAGALATSGQQVTLAGVQAAPAAAAQSNSTTVGTAVTDAVTSLRENLQLRRVAGVRVTKGVVGTYMHNAVNLASEPEAATAALQIPAGLRMGRQGALLAIEASTELTADQRCALTGLANKLAMQVVASTPKFVRREDIAPDVLEKERAVLTEQAQAPPVHVPGQAPKKTTAKAKDPKQIARMVDGRIAKWLSEVVFLDQPVVISGGDDWDMAKPPTVGQVLKDAGAKFNTELNVVGLERFLVGEGVQTNKSGDSFAKEVADKIAQAK